MLELVKNTMFQIRSYFDFEKDSNTCSNSRQNSKDLLELVEEAKKEWVAAKRYFENVSEPDLIDYAIHSMKATEKRYNYLLKKVKQMDLEEIK